MSDLLHLWLPVSARKSSAHMKQIPRNRCNCSLIENCRFPPLWLDSSQRPHTRPPVCVMCCDTERRPVTTPNWPADWDTGAAIFCIEPLEMHISPAVKPQSVSQKWIRFFSLCTKFPLLAGLYMVKTVQGLELQPQCPVCGSASGSKESLLFSCSSIGIELTSKHVCDANLWHVDRIGKVWTRETFSGNTAMRILFTMDY